MAPDISHLTVISSEPRKLDGKDLHEFAELIRPETFIPLGLHLGLEFTFIERIKYDNRTSIGTAMEKMLHEWQANLPNDVDQPGTLINILKEVQQINAAVKFGKLYHVDHRKEWKLKYILNLLSPGKETVYY